MRPSVSISALAWLAIASMVSGAGRGAPWWLRRAPVSTPPGIGEQASEGEAAQRDGDAVGGIGERTPVQELGASSGLCPFGQVMSDGGGWTVSDAVTFPFLPELNVALALTGPLTVVLFWALGLAPPLLTPPRWPCPARWACS